MTNGQVPKNEFRDEVKAQTVSEQDMLERDQRIAYLSMKNQMEMKQADCKHIQEGIDRVTAFGNVIFKLPDSKGRISVLEENKLHIERLIKQLVAQSTSGAHIAILSVLEEKFGLQAIADEKAVDSEPEELRDD